MVCSSVLLLAGVATFLFEILEERVLSLPSLSGGDGAAALPSTAQVGPASIGEWEEASAALPQRQPPLCLFALDDSVGFLAKRASLSVRKAWQLDPDSDLLNVDMCAASHSFCDIIYIPELEMCTKTLSSLALDVLKVKRDCLTEQHMDEFHEFVYCLKQQRPRLNVPRRLRFDRSWGIDSKVHFGCGAAAPFSRVDVLIKREMDASRELYQQSMRKLAVLSEATGCVGKSVADGIVGTRLLHGFMLDLLGRQEVAASVYRKKLGEG